MNDRSRLKALMAPYFHALYEGQQAVAAEQLSQLCASDAVFHLSHPFGSVAGAAAWNHGPMQQLFHAFADVERRDFILIAGRTEAGDHWVGTAGYYLGTFSQPLLGIPPTGRITGFRYHEFYRFDGDAMVEFQGIWDLAELMQNAKVWPMGPSLGVPGMTPGPATQDGRVVSSDSDELTRASTHVVTEMLVHMGKHPQQPVEAMKLDTFWHPHFNWYGPGGIGAMRGVAGFRHDHQIPFLNAMPDRRGGYDNETYFWGDENYVGVTAWPGMRMTLTGDGWLGMAPTNQPITMRSLDFWRVENGKIRENWVLVDLLDVWHQLEVDVLARMRQLVSHP